MIELYCEYINIQATIGVTRLYIFGRKKILTNSW